MIKSKFVQATAPAALIVLAGWFVYAPAFHGGWIWDDDVEITANAALTSMGGLRDIWIAPHSPDYFPLKSSLQWVQWHLWGSSVAGYHLTNVALHLLAAILLWRILRRLGLRFAWLGGLLFAVHPLAVESVAWVSELKNVLSLVLLLGAFLAYERWEVGGGRLEDRALQPPTSSLPPRPPLLYLTSLLLFAAAMLSKSSVVMFPFVLLLYCWWKRGRVGRRDWGAVAPFFVVSVALGIVTVWFQSHRAIGGEVIPMGGLLSRIAGAGLAVAFYLGKAIWPVKLLPIYPGWNIDPPRLWQFWPWVAVALITMAIGKAFLTGRSGRSGRRGASGLLPDLPDLPVKRLEICRGLVFGLGFFVINLVPVMGFVPMSILRITRVADHLAYLPLVGIVALAAAALGKLSELEQEGREDREGRDSVKIPDLPVKTALVGVLLAVVLAVQARSYAAKFAGPRTLWSYELELNPSAWAADNNLGNALFDAGDVRGAAARYAEALRLHPDYPEALNNLGNIESQSGPYADAARRYERALALKPNYAQARNGLGSLLFKTGHIPEAIEQLNRAIRSNPAYAPAQNNLGNVYFQLGQLAEAERHLDRALLIEPDYPEALNNLGNVYMKTGRRADAVEQYRRALRARANFPEAWNNLGNVLMMAGHRPDAMRAFEQALRLRPGYPEAHYNLGLVCLSLGRNQDAIAQFKLTLQLRPNFPQARLKLEQLEKLSSGHE